MEEELHVGIPFENFVKNKSLLLEAKEKLLRLLEKLRSLKQIRDQKITIYRMLNSSYKDFVTLQAKLKKNLPNIRIEKEEENLESIKQLTKKEDLSLEEELESIQKKLKQLNALTN